MYDLKSDTDNYLAIFVNDYVENKLDAVECAAFEEYLSLDPDITLLVNKLKQGKRALRNAYRVEAADDFEEKLARRIAQETEPVNN